MLRQEMNGIASLLVGMEKNRKKLEYQKLNDEKHRQRGEKKGLA